MPWRPADNPTAWIDLDPEEYDRAWTAVETAFSFRPTTDDRRWRSFAEPVDSKTWSLRPLFDKFAEAFEPAEGATSAALRDALCTVTEEGEWVFALDWQHPGYRFDPRRATPAERIDSWLVPTLPDGDYYLFVASDLRFGWLTHPWEQSVCVYGSLLEAIEPYILSVGWPLMRSAGQAISP